MIKHVLFDCDGVLVDTEIIAAQRVVAMLRSLTIDITVDHYLQTFTGSTFSSVLNSYLSETHSTEEQNEFREEMEQQVKEALKPVDGVSMMLESLDIEKSVVSNSWVATVEYALAKCGISHYFEGRIYSSELVEKGKPAPDVYHLAIDDLGLSTSQIIVIEDSFSGIMAAQAANLEVIGFTGASHMLPGHEQRMRDNGISEIASSMNELSIVINNRLNHESDADNPGN